MNNLALGFELMGFGLFGVFFVLMLFYGLVMLLVNIFPVKEEKADNESN